jgi:hypothetical protein
MGAQYPRIKNWTDLETLTNEDLNAEIDNILNSHDPAGMDDQSATVTNMREETTPGAQGSESLATSLKGELLRLRFVLRRLLGETYWYDAPDITLASAQLLFNLALALPENRIDSGKPRSATDSHPIFLQAAGSAATVTLKAAVTPFVYYINGTQYTISTDVSFTGLSTAPTINNTALVNNSLLTGQVDSRHAGEFDTVFPELGIDTVGTEISSLVGKYVAFKIISGANTEYFIAFIKDATTLSQCYRGFFFSSVDAPIKRIVISDNDTITLMRLAWVFATTTGTLLTTYTNPRYSFDTPSAPSTGDYWFDLNAKTWKQHDGSGFVAANATLIGACFQDGTNCIGSRSFPIFAAFNALNTAELVRTSVNQVTTNNRGARISIMGQVLLFDQDRARWDMPASFNDGDAYSGSEAVSTTYFLYLTDKGDTVISDIRPHDRRYDLLGRYHPYHSWRYLGEVDNDSASDFTQVVTKRVGITAAIDDIARSAAVTVGVSGLGLQTIGTISLVTTGRPVVLALTSGISTSPSDIRLAPAVNPTNPQIRVFFNEDGVALAEQLIHANDTSATIAIIPGLPPGVFSFIHASPTPGKHTNTATAVNSDTTTVTTFTNVRFIAYEL